VVTISECSEKPGTRMDGPARMGGKAAPNLPPNPARGKLSFLTLLKQKGLP